MFGDKSISFLKFHNTVITGTISSKGGLGRFDFINCIFIYNHYRIIEVELVVEVRIINCKFTPSVYHDKCRNVLGCVIYAKGFGKNPPMNKITIISLFTTCRRVNDGTQITHQSCGEFYSENSVFVGSLGDNGGIIECEDMDFYLVNCYFSLTENQKVNSEGGFIYYRFKYGVFTANNITFNASDIQSNTFISIIDLHSQKQIFRNTQIKCPKSLGVSGKRQKLNEITIQHLYVCQKTCTSNEYTYQAGSTILSGTSDAREQSHDDVTGTANNPNCSPCPIGANCSNNIINQALPNYWGYKDRHDIVSMIRCPDDYSCQEKETCRGIDSCNVNRTGPLCGRCRAKWTEVLFSAKCLLVDDCPAALILVFYTIGVISYGLGLMAISYIKDVGPVLVKKILKAATEAVLCRKGKTLAAQNELEDSALSRQKVRMKLRQRKQNS